MNADLLAVLDYWEREKGIRRDLLVLAVEEAMVTAARKAVGPARELTCTVDPKNGSIRAFARLIVSEKVISKHDQISLADARRVKPDAQVGEELPVEVTPANFGRIASQNAKQALMQQLRKLERELILAEFKDRVGQLISGTVRRFDRSDVLVDLGKFDALLPNKERVPTEDYEVGERIRCYVKAVEDSAGAAGIILSRAAPEFVLQLFRMEVAEINDGTIEIKAIAREPGYRTKIAVHSRDPKVDPVGACVGLRGQRVKNIVRELNNEKVDIIPWSADIATFVTKALSPAKLKHVTVDEPNRRVTVLVTSDQLSLAIGRRGQNARLSERLTGWSISVEEELVQEIGFDEQYAAAVKLYAGIPGVTGEEAAQLGKMFHTVADFVEGVEQPDDLKDYFPPERAQAVFDLVRAHARAAAEAAVAPAEPEAVTS
ncbi:MAG TPA: transcription termination factor NusA [Verrucomicrobiota bacterium]|nr:transcription termination factor NusA [Verrucomicrobiota bacterium]